ncbi:MAG: type II toxin-antitoxin system HicB family antitoxin [Deltaproteobacteria bacterium]|nr:MAG: type II toxin-antitoxin system HicB family antitoxin [Deltaproteobacteria bacterium]
MAKRRYRYTMLIVPEKDGRGYYVAVPAVPGCFSQGRTIDEARRNARKAIALHVQSVRAREPIAASKAITVRVPLARLRKLMRARKAATQSELINSLLAEEEERLRSHGVLRETAGTARASEIRDRLL